MTRSEHQGAFPWIPDNGDGTYSNPVIHADYSDPDVVRVGEDFFMTSSSFNCTPGLPILHSRDLVNWTIVNHALKQLPDPRFCAVQHGQGVWAPSIRHHDARFWIVFPMPDEGIFVTTAQDPRGEWSAPVLLMEGKGLIDPCPLWDDDGQAYLVHAYAGSRAGTRNKIHVRPVSTDLTRVLGEGKIVASIDERLPALEGPKWLKRDGWYYISAPSGGVEKGWQTIFRSRHVYGPYEEKIVLAQRDTPINGPHQGALVDTPSGEWWFMHFQDVGAYGRIVHLQPVRWEDGWPLIGVDQNEEGLGKPVLRARKPDATAALAPVVPQTSDDFASGSLGLQWQWHSNHCDSWYSLAEAPGKLRLFAQSVPAFDFASAGSLLLQKFPAREFVVETELALPEGHRSLHAGLLVIGLSHAALDVSRVGDRYQVTLFIDGVPQLDVLHTKKSGPIRLALRVGAGATCRFGVTGGGAEFCQVGPSFKAQPGHWIGAKFGVYCLSPDAAPATGYADFSYVDVRAPRTPPGHPVPAARGANGAHHGKPSQERRFHPVDAA